MRLCDWLGFAHIRLGHFPLGEAGVADPAGVVFHVGGEAGAAHAAEGGALLFVAHEGAAGDGVVMFGLQGAEQQGASFGGVALFAVGFHGFADLFHLGVEGFGGILPGLLLGAVHHHAEDHRLVERLRCVLVAEDFLELACDIRLCGCGLGGALPALGEGWGGDGGWGWGRGGGDLGGGLRG